MFIADGPHTLHSNVENTKTRKRRIFWLGAHKILIKTELKILRDLGYEVFVPHYLSNIDDQSAVTRLHIQEDSTLPSDLYSKLSEYNFFYNSIDCEIEEILNCYFDAAIVTIVGRWCSEFLRVFEGPVLFRTYGQTSLISEDFERLGVQGLWEERKNVHFLPHAIETAELEGEWLKQKMRVVPYSVASDTFDHQGCWRGPVENNDYILISAPNIANIFHRFHYRFLKKHFYHPHYRFLGVQTKSIADPQVLGTLPLDGVIDQFMYSSGYMYTYSDPRVCYLPPIEMMVYGGPVIYLRGSLLARYFNNQGPGECRTIDEAYEKSRRLLQKDRSFISELQSAQEAVVERYRPSYVAPKLEAAVRDLIGPPTISTAPSCAAVSLPVSLSAMTHAIAGRMLKALLESEGEKVSADDILEQHLDETYGPVTSVTKERLLTWWRDAEPVELDVQWGAVDVLAHPQAGSLAGRLVADAGTGGYAREASVGESGYLFFGPYLSIQAGRYAALFALEIEATDAPATVRIDVSASGIEYVSRNITVTEGCVSTVEVLEWLVETDLNGIEFRVLSSGTGKVRLTSLTYHQK
ncbi:hypothetical protein [Rhizobium sp. SL86]|uniref:hypothetical protein n=1 Tax=Rhizobium sp. SL86 TaxID=2995148 RepID=UPI002272C67A|nr:hypothetical protein [Rhizobium sp. SL86]MCY1669393.1 hypothetical protein [Rhizobium sp. SL86]